MDFVPVPRYRFQTGCHTLREHDVTAAGSANGCWTCAFKHIEYPEFVCVVMSGRSNRQEWFGNYIVKVCGDVAYVVNKCTLVVGCQQLCPSAPDLDADSVVVECVSGVLGKRISSITDRQSDVGFLLEDFQCWAPEDYCDAFAVGISYT